MSEWISVKDQRPKDWQVVDGWFAPSELRLVNTWLCRGKGWYSQDDDVYLIESSVTHWMPLPEPPKEQSNE